MRNYARLHVTMWVDPEWRVLPLGAQWLYLHILSSGELNLAGVITLAPKRWALMAANADEDDVALWLSELEDHRFVMVDHETCEVMVRTFLRHDGMLRNQKMAKAVRQAAAQVLSPDLRGALSTFLEVEDRRSRSGGNEWGSTIPDLEDQIEIDDPKVSAIETGTPASASASTSATRSSHQPFPTEGFGPFETPPDGFNGLRREAGLTKLRVTEPEDDL